MTATEAAPAEAKTLVLSLPTVAIKIEVGIDQLRKIVKRRPDLQAMMQRVGSTRLLPVGRLDEFRTAVHNPPAA